MTGVSRHASWIVPLGGLFVMTSGLGYRLGTAVLAALALNACIPLKAAKRPSRTARSVNSQLNPPSGTRPGSSPATTTTTTSTTTSTSSTTTIPGSASSTTTTTLRSVSTTTTSTTSTTTTTTTTTSVPSNPSLVT